MDFSLKTLEAEASHRRYERIFVSGRPVGALLMWDKGFGSGCAQAEAFLSLQQILARAGVGVPELWGLNPKLGCAVVEDLGPWELCHVSAKHRLKMYKKAVDEILKIQSIPRSKALPWGDFTSRIFARELEFCADQFNLNTQALGREFLYLSELLCRAEFKLCHRDFHSRNLILRRARAGAPITMGVVDFQDARPGPLVYDLVSLVFDAYVRLPKAEQEQLVQYYMLKARALNLWPQALSQKEANRLFYLQALQRLIKMCGNFMHFCGRGDLKYRASLDKSAEDLLVIAPAPELKELLDACPILKAFIHKLTALIKTLPREAALHG